MPVEKQANTFVPLLNHQPLNISNEHKRNTGKIVECGSAILVNIF
jgi:hypothetical protein